MVLSQDGLECECEALYAEECMVLWLLMPDCQQGYEHTVRYTWLNIQPFLW